MKKTALLALATIALAACGERTVVIQQPAPTTTEARVEVVIGVDTYIDDILTEKPELLNSLGKKWVIDSAYATCGAIDEGMTINDLLDMASATNADGASVGILVRLAINNICPENQWFIDAIGKA